MPRSPVRSLLAAGAILVVVAVAAAWAAGSAHLPELAMRSAAPGAQVEVGGPYVGLETHGSSPLLGKLAFYYPVAVTARADSDYWQRARSRIMRLGLRVGRAPVEWLDEVKWKLDLTPFGVRFRTEQPERNARAVGPASLPVLARRKPGQPACPVSVTYRFCKSDPAMVATFEVENRSEQCRLVELVTWLELGLRTSHSDARRDRARTAHEPRAGHAVFATFDEADTGPVEVFVANAGEPPASFATVGEDGDVPVGGPPTRLAETVTPAGRSGRPVAAFVYRRTLAPRGTLSASQLIGSCRPGEGRQLVPRVLARHAEQVSAYEREVVRKASGSGVPVCGDAMLDHSARWARAILETNRHYLEGAIVPMPCQAEYNFFFTHDALQTDLTAVFFDAARVKADLLYIARHASAQHVIPHAYYWKDGRYVAEYVGPDNWNHAWFVIVAARYLRHTGDVATLRALRPLLRESLARILGNRGPDGLLWAHRPDWWDVGDSHGPRAYSTILGLRALREYAVAGSRLGEDPRELSRLAAAAADLQKRLQERLWDGSLGGLVNGLAGGGVDRHLYIGSLLAAHFRALDPSRTRSLIDTATDRMLDPRAGIYNAVPMDFIGLERKMKFLPGEVGEPFRYMNGGIWPHGNAWYALGLMELGEWGRARDFVRDVMSVDGVAAGPNGQPAMYECRNGNRGDPAAYGTVDKPQFLWAAAWYLYCLYHLLGLRETEWNLGFVPAASAGSSRFEVVLGGRQVKVGCSGQGQSYRRIAYDGRPVHTAVVPRDATPEGRIDLELGPPGEPYLAACDAVPLEVRFEGRTLQCRFWAPRGHESEVVLISRVAPRTVTLRGRAERPRTAIGPIPGGVASRVRIRHGPSDEVLTVVFP